jgi:hypothetical protein
VSDERDKLREEIIAFQQAQAEIKKWKVIGIGAVFALGLGYSAQQAGDTSLALFAIPFVTVYCDLLIRDYDLRIAILGRFISKGEDGLARYEQFIHGLGPKGISWWISGHIADTMSSIVTNLAIPALVWWGGVGQSARSRVVMSVAAIVGVVVSLIIHLSYEGLRARIAAQMPDEPPNKPSQRTGEAGR